MYEFCLPETEGETDRLTQTERVGKSERRMWWKKGVVAHCYAGAAEWWGTFLQV